MASRGRTNAAPEDATHARLMDFQGKFLPQLATCMSGPRARYSLFWGASGDVRPCPNGGGSGASGEVRKSRWLWPALGTTGIWQARVGSILVSEAAFDAALASRDPAAVQMAFDKFYAFR